MQRSRAGYSVLVVAVFAVVTVSSVAWRQLSAQAQVIPSDWNQKAPPVVADGTTHLIISGVSGNFPWISAWLLGGMINQFPRGTFRGDIIFIGTNGAAKALTQVGDGLAHVTITTPPATAYMAYKGVGMYPKAYPNLRGVFNLPQRDPITLAVRADLGFTSFDEIIRKKYPLRISSGHKDSERAIGFLFLAFLKASGTSMDELESWGGKLLEEDNSGPAMTHIEKGEADALFHEADVVSSPQWKALNDKIPMRVLSIPDRVIDKLGEYGFHKFEYPLPKGKYPGVMEDVTTIDYSDWVVVCDASVPDDIVYKMAKVAAEQHAGFESRYRDILPAGSKELGQYVADPKQMWKNLGAPIHPGAAKYFKEKGYMP